MRNRSKWITVDVDVDVELDLFDTEDLIDELYYRLKERGNKDVDVSKLIPLLTDPNSGFCINSLIDQMKLEYITKVFSEYSIEEVQTLLPQKL